MQISFLGANCLQIKINDTSIVIDDNLHQLGAKSMTESKDTVCITDTDLIEHPKQSKIVFDMPGRYEVGSVLINGIAVDKFRNTDSNSQSTLYKITTDTCSLVVTGHINPDLSDKQLEQIGLVDILCVPVGGSGYTLEPKGAIQLIKSIDPKIVIPTHYNQKGLKFDVAQLECDEFVKQIGVAPEYSKNPFKPKNVQAIDKLQIVILQ